MKRSALMRGLAITFALSLLAAACGGSDSAEDAAGDSTSQEASTASEPEDLGGVDEDAAQQAIEDAGNEEAPAADAAPAAGSIEELEAQWAEERAAIVADIKANGYGVTDGILTGPGGWTVDLSNCPGDWSDTDGIVDGKVKIALTIAQSGTLAVYGNLGTGQGVYYDYINANGGIGPDGLQIEFVTKDDAYDANLTQEYVEEFMGSDRPFLVQTLGTPNTFSVRDRLNDECVPHPLSMTGHPAWGDPQGFPWTTGMQLNYFTEGVLWGSWIENNLADKAPVTVAALVADNDFGLAYEKGFLNFAAGSDIIGDVEVVRHDVAAATLTNEITTLAASNPNVFIAMTAGAPCTMAFQEAARSGIVESADAVWAPSVCASASFLGPAEDAADGWLAFGGGWKDPADDALVESDVFLSWIKGEIGAAGLDTEVSLLSTGVGEFGWPMIQTLQIAAELDGGLTRTNFMLALRSLSMTHPFLLDGITFSNNGAEDAYLVEGTQINVWDSAAQSSKQVGGVVDLNGSSGTCSWSEDGC